MTHRIRVLIGVLSVLVLVLPSAAAAQTPSASPVAQDDGWQIAGVRELPEDARGEVLSPDGRWLAFYRLGGEFCFWEVSTRDVTCSRQSLPDWFALDPFGDSFVWAPDSTAVAFAVPPNIGGDSDIYLVEIADARMVNLTDDQFEGSVVKFPRGVPIDDTPAWSPDSQQIAFSRMVTDAAATRESIMRVNRRGGEPVEIIPLDLNFPMLISTPMAWLPDGTLLYTQWDSLTPDDPRNGLWQGVPSGPGGQPAGSTKQLVPGMADAEVPFPFIHDVHPKRGLVSLYAGDPSVPSDAALWLLDVTDGAMTPLPDLDIDGPTAKPTQPAVLSPDGMTALSVYAAGKRHHLVMLDLATSAFQVLDPSSPEPIYLSSPCAENDTLLAYAGEQGTVRKMVHVERSTEATPDGGGGYTSAREDRVRRIEERT